MGQHQHKQHTVQLGACGVGGWEGEGLQAALAGWQACLVGQRGHAVQLGACQGWA